jgi:hypothetical protein
MDPQKIKHLEIIQAVVNRVAGNSFSIKGWSVALISGLFALSAKDHDRRYILISYFPVVMFWILDGYYLFQERLFRKLYDKNRTDQNTISDYSMSTAGLEDEATSWASAIFSKTILLFHGVIFLTICIVMLFLCAQ